MNKPIDLVTFIPTEEKTIEGLVAEAVSLGADNESIQIFLNVLKENGCAVLDGWDVYLTD